jgi:hypothetical protein
VPTRTCGTCTLCCKLLAVAELAKPANTWCQHCPTGKGGCSIFESEERPAACKSFRCAWLADQDGLLFPEEMKPERSRFVAYLSQAEGVPGGFWVFMEGQPGILDSKRVKALIHSVVASGRVALLVRKNQSEIRGPAEAAAAVLRSFATH